jgi:hypothetical protein
MGLCGGGGAEAFVDRLSKAVTVEGGLKHIKVVKVADVASAAVVRGLTYRDIAEG